MRYTVAAMVVLLAIGTTQAGPADSPTRAVEAFYVAYLEVRPSGLPNESQMRRLAPFLSKRLATLLRDASRLRAKITKDWPPDTKPPLADGCLFASLFEGPHAFRVLNAGPLSEGRQRVLVQLTFMDPSRPGERLDWQDAVWVIDANGVWLVDDIEYLGDWEFMRGRASTLAALLTAHVQEWTERIESEKCSNKGSGLDGCAD